MGATGQLEYCDLTDTLFVITFFLMPHRMHYDLVMHLIKVVKRQVPAAAEVNDAFPEAFLNWAANFWGVNQRG